MPLTSHEVNCNTQTHKRGCTPHGFLFRKKSGTHSRSPEFRIRPSFVLDLFLASMEFRKRLFSERFDTTFPGQSMVWHGIYRLDLGLLGLAGRVQP
jgi:hypothetical protein